MAWPMIEWVLDMHYTVHFNRSAWQERSIIVFGAAEAVLTPLMERIEAGHPGVKVFSLPSVDHPTYGRHIDLGVKGAPEAVAVAFADLKAGLAPFGLRCGPDRAAIRRTMLGTGHACTALVRLDLVHGAMTGSWPRRRHGSQSRRQCAFSGVRALARASCAAGMKAA
jgi:hypothetical protein